MIAASVQFGLFDAPPAPSLFRPLRPYQAEAVRRIGEELKANRSTLLVLPTGTGKTRTFSEVVQHWPGPVLVIAHRDELISQARIDLEENCHELISTEKAEQRAYGTRIVVASVATLRGERLKLFARRHPATLIVVDEAHHAVSAGYRAIFDAFPNAKILGVTATPDRTDERAMGQVFDSVAFVYEILDAIRENYLCPIRCKDVDCGEIDLSQISTVLGDLNQGELDAVMSSEAVIHRVVAPSDRGDSLIQLAGDRRTIVFCTSVEAAHRYAEVINRYKVDSARAVDGGTAPDSRKALLRDHQAGRYQTLCNVGVLTEGYNDPAVSCIAMTRPTKSRSLYAQCVGRGLRIFGDKPDCLVLNFVGKGGKHELSSSLDILAGTYDDEIVERAKEIVKKTGAGILASEALEQAQRERDAKVARGAARRAQLQVRGNVNRIVTERDPFARLGVSNPEADPRMARFSVPATDPQKNALRKLGVEFDEAKLTKRGASALMDARKGKATLPMVKACERAGVSHDQAMALPFDKARDVLSMWSGRGYKRLEPEQLSQLIGRQPGEEG